MTDGSGWSRVGDAAAWTRGRGRRVEVEGVPVAIFRDRAGWLALDDTCPHMGASLADGHLSGRVLQCSWHEWRYDTATGICPIRPWARVRVHEVRVEDGGVFLRLAPSPEPKASREPSEADDPEWVRWDPSRYFKRKPAQGS